MNIDEEQLDSEDLEALRAAKSEEADAPSILLLDVKKELGLRMYEYLS
jgi:hypothetical protein